MTYFETELVFTPEKQDSKNITKSRSGLPNGKEPGTRQAEVLGITLRLGNRPLVYNLKQLCQRSGKPGLLSDQDHYLVVHSISALRTQGNARVDELQYFATATEPGLMQTIDLIPKTRFNEIVRADLNLDGCLDLFGQFSLDVPSAMMDQLLDEFIEMGAGIKLQLSTSSRFIGRFVYSLRIPVVQASGIGSDCCSWILKPDENKTPLLGDQLLIQSIAVPKGTMKVAYTISGLVKADRGIFWKQREKRTSECIIEVNLNTVDPKQHL